MDKKTHDNGLEIRKAVLGEAYVANALKNADDFNRPFQELVTEYCWGAVWGREELPHKTRSMLNLAMISILNRPHELRAHIKGALTNGVSRDGRDLCRHSRGRRQFPDRARSVRRTRQGLRAI
jgi:4-carboxymuconolactone decarboxylase